MKRKLFSFIFALTLILPCAILFSACDKDDDKGSVKTLKSIAVDVKNNDYDFDNGVLTFAYGDDIDIQKSDFEVKKIFDDNSSEETDDYTITLPEEFSQDVIPVGDDYVITFTYDVEGDNDLTATITVEIEKSLIIKPELTNTLVSVTEFNGEAQNIEDLILNSTNTELATLKTLIISGVVELKTISNDANSKLTALNAGTYTFQIVPADNFAWATSDTAINCSWTIAKKAIAVPTLTSSEFNFTHEWNGDEGKFVGENKTVTVNSEYAYKDMVELLNATSSSAGNYVATATIKDEYKNNYVFAGGQQSANIDWVINPMTVGKVNISSTTYKYTGEMIAPLTLTGDNTKLINATLSDDNPIEVGTYTYTVSFNTENIESINNYVWAEQMTNTAYIITYNIASKGISVNNTNWTITSNPQYTGEAYTNTLASVGSSYVTYKNYYKATENGTYTEINTAPTNVGYYKTIAEVDNNYYLYLSDDLEMQPIPSSSLISEWRITEKIIETPTLATTEFNFTHTWNADENKFVGENKTATINNTYAYKDIIELANATNKNAGTYTAVATIKDEYKNNYAFVGGQESVNLEYTISAMEVTKPTLDVINYNYTGTTIAPLTLTGEDANLLKAILSNDNPINVGTYTYTISFNGEKIQRPNNYVWAGEQNNSSYQVTYTINPARINTTTLSWIYNNGVEHSGSGVENLLNTGEANVGEIVYKNYYKASEEGDYSEITTTPTDVGYYKTEAIISSNYTLYLNDSPVTNDQLIVEWRITQTIDCSDIEWSIEDGAALTYNGESQLPELTNLPLGITASYDIAEAIDVGEYTIIAMLDYDANLINLENQADEYTTTFNIVPQNMWLYGGWIGAEDVYYQEGVSKSIAFEFYETQNMFNVSYKHYKESGDTYIETEDISEVGRYHTYLMLEYINSSDEGNYTIYINGNELASAYCEWNILDPSSVDCSNIDWSIGEGYEFIYNGESQLPELINLPLGITATYDITEAIDVGEYTIIAMLDYDADNMTLENVSDEYKITFNIIARELTEDDFNWLYSEPINYDGQSHTVELEYNNFTDFVDIVYTDNEYSEIGTYTATAEITLLDQENGNVTVQDGMIILELEWEIVDSRPFISVQVGETTYTYDEFNELEYLMVGDIVTFTPNNGAEILVDYEPCTSFVVDESVGFMSISTNQGYYKGFNIAITTLEINDNDLGYVQLGSNVDYVYQTTESQLVIKLSDSVASMGLYYYDGEEYQPLTTSTLTITNVANISRMNFVTIETDGNNTWYNTKFAINIFKPTYINNVVANVYDYYGNASENVVNRDAGSDYDYNIYCNDIVVADLSVSLKEGYEDYLVEITDKLGNTVDYTILDTKELLIKIKNSEGVEVETQTLRINYNLNLSINNAEISQINGEELYINTTDSNIAIQVKDSSYHLITSNVITKINNEEFVTLTSYGMYSYPISVIFNVGGTNYTYSNNLIINRSYDRDDYFYQIRVGSEDHGYSMVDYGNRLNSTLSIAQWNLLKDDPNSVDARVREGYSYTKLFIPNSTTRLPYIKFIITETANPSNVCVVIVYCQIDGEIDNNTNVTITEYSMTDVMHCEDKTEEAEGDELILSNYSNTYILYVEAENEDVIIQLIDSNGIVLSQNIYGNIEISFNEAGIYTLRIIATDGTARDIDITVEGEFLPLLYIKAGDAELSMDLDMSTGEVLGNVDLIGSGTPNMKMFGYLGATTQEVGSSFEFIGKSSMAEAITDKDGQPLTNINSNENCVLVIQEDDGTITGVEGMKYIMVYSNMSISGMSIQIPVYFLFCDRTDLSPVKITIGQKDFALILDPEGDSFGSFSYEDSEGMLIAMATREDLALANDATSTEVTFSFKTTYQDASYTVVVDYMEDEPTNVFAPQSSTTGTLIVPIEDDMIMFVMAIEGAESFDPDYFIPIVIVITD